MKIQDKERLEPPHVTIRRRSTAWRWDLRRRAFMDTDPDPRDLPDAIAPLLATHHPELVAAWDERFPGNPVNGDA